MSAAFSTIEQRLNHVEQDAVTRPLVESMIETSNNAIKAEIEQIPLDQEDRINQLDRKFSERYRQIDHISSNQIELKKTTSLMEVNLKRALDKIESFEMKSSSQGKG